MAEKTVQIGVAGNTQNPTLLAIRAKGYKITLSYTIDPKGNYLSWYEAERDGNRFGGTIPEELLGIIAMWEIRGNDWQLQDNEQGLFQELHENALVYDREGNLVEE